MAPTDAIRSRCRRRRPSIDYVRGPRVISIQDLMHVKQSQRE